MNSNRNFDEKKMKRFNQDIKKVLFLLFFHFLAKEHQKHDFVLFFEQFAVPLQHNKDIKYEKEVNIYHFCIFSLRFMFASANRKEGASHRHNTRDGDADTEMQSLIYSRSSCP